MRVRVVSCAIVAIIALGAIHIHAAEPAPPSNELERNKAVVRRFIDALNLNDAAGAAKILDEIVSPEMDNHASGKKGADALKAIVAALQKEAPDQKYVIDAIVADGDLVVIRTTRTGTSQLDKFRGYTIKPGTKFTTQHAHFWRLKNGKIVEHWAVRDDLGMAQQLGAIAKP